MLAAHEIFRPLVLVGVAVVVFVIVRGELGARDIDPAMRKLWRMLMIVAAVILTLTVVGLWLATDASEDAQRATAANCRNQVQSEERDERALIADVRIARAQVAAAVARLVAIDATLAEEPLDLSVLSPQGQDFVGRFVERDRQALLREQRVAVTEIEAIQAELDTRERSLDELRTGRTTCPP